METRIASPTRHVIGSNFVAASIIITRHHHSHQVHSSADTQQTECHVRGVLCLLLHVFNGFVDLVRCAAFSGSFFTERFLIKPTHAGRQETEGRSQGLQCAHSASSSGTEEHKQSAHAFTPAANLLEVGTVLGVLDSVGFCILHRVSRRHAFLQVLSIELIT